jgi:hypothetical protein
MMRVYPADGIGTVVMTNATAFDGACQHQGDTSMGLYELSVFVHVAAAVALLSGSVVASPGVRRRSACPNDARDRYVPELSRAWRSRSSP